MKRITLILMCSLIVWAPLHVSSLAAPAIEPSGLQEQHSSVCADLNDLMRLIRDNRITRDAARASLQRLLDEARAAYYLADGTDAPRTAWHFPVAGGDMHAIAGGRRHGYVASGYDFYDGNRHGGHPALDIFIRDRHRRCRDDRTDKPVRVLSLTAGIVIAAENSWEEGSRLRGGRYLWVYDPGNDLLVYYAHNDRLLVGIGDLVRPGDAIAIVGRSGYNAAMRRSPTHLHLSVLKIDGGRMMPVDVYQDLRKSRVSDGG